ncbi:g4987 [Coccomyxa elongata]
MQLTPTASLASIFPDIVEYAERWANQGKIVIIAALDGTFQCKAFNCILELIPLAEEVINLQAVCNGCRREAAFIHRLGKEQEVEVVGGAENYVAVCRNGYHSFMDSKNAPAAPPPGTPTSVVRPKRRSSRVVAGSGQQRRASSPLPTSDVEERRLSLQALTLR